MNFFLSSFNTVILCLDDAIELLECVQDSLDDLWKQTEFDDYPQSRMNNFLTVIGRVFLLHKCQISIFFFHFFVEFFQVKNYVGLHKNESTPIFPLCGKARFPTFESRLKARSRFAIGGFMPATLCRLVYGSSFLLIRGRTIPSKLRTFVTSWDGFKKYELACWC